ncbi:MAG: hypothetical protein VX778_02855 [Candidatus Thermoplasmatota archaeon]|nr:hypothetical protein [Candidatus Thermoplasmatota archaeon]
MASARYANTNKSLLLITLMILMTQVGYLENLNPWTNGEETLDETDDVMETGGSSFVYANNKIATGYSTTCAILDNGSLTCWGYDGDGQLGNGATLTADQHAPPATFIDLGQGRTAVAVDFTFDHGCAILNDGSVKCWGYDNKGQLGDGGTLPAAPGTHSPSPVSVDLGIGRTAVSIATGY